MFKKLSIVFLIAIVLIVGFLLPTGLRAAFANNLWSLKFLQAYMSPFSQLPEEPKTHPHAGLLLARNALNQGNISSALAYLQPQVQAADPYALDTYAEILFLDGQYEPASQIWSQLGREQTLEQVLRHAQANALSDAYFYAAQGLYHINPEKFTPNLSHAYTALNQNDQALAILQQSIQAYPSSENQALWYRYLGDIYTSTRQLELAESAYRISLELDPLNSKAWRNLGVFYRGQLKDLDQALICFQKMIEIDPKDTYAHILVAQTYESLGQKSNAIQAYQQVLNLDPNNGQAQKAIQSLTND